jgi:C1A family cysteine protease
MNKLRILKILAIMSLALLFNKGDAVVQPPAGNVKEAPISFANPAAVYCIDLGYSYGVQETEEGQVGFCTFPDGLSCNAWDFLAGKCGQANSFCARQGYQLETRWDGKDMFSQEYAVCLTKEGQEVGTVAALSDLNRKATEGCGAKAPETIVEEGSVEDAPSEEILTTLPTSFDWRSRPKGNYLTNVKDQGQCGSCWAFSAVGTTEAALNIAADKVGNNFDLSEQYLVSDCLSGNNCNGGWKDVALNFIKSDGIPDEACMPYVDGNWSTGCGYTDTGCKTNCTYRTGGSCSDTTCSDRCSQWSSRLNKISSTGAVAAVRDTIKSTLISKGPLAVSLRMNGTFDSNGVYKCTTDSPTNHAVVMVGYDDADQYWIIRNSWDSTWNGDGYFKVGYGECSIEQKVFYATAPAASPIPVLVSPAGTISDKTPTFTWMKVTGATQYRYQVMKGATLVYTMTVPASACGTTNCTNTPATTLAYGAYKWHAQVYVSGAWKTYSAYKDFTVVALTPGFNSNFNGSAAGWSAVNGAWNIYSGVYYRSTGLANTGSSAKHTGPAGGTYRNFTYEARMSRSGVCTSCANRIIIRGNPASLDPENKWKPSYVFQYTNNGSFSVSETSSTGSIVTLKGWTTSTTIVLNGWNTLKVVANGPSLKFYINDTLVWSGSDTTLTTGRVGFGFYRDAAAGTLVVDWAKLTVITSSPVDENSIEEVAPGEEIPGGDENHSP